MPHGDTPYLNRIQPRDLKIRMKRSLPRVLPAGQYALSSSGRQFEYPRILLRSWWVVGVGATAARLARRDDAGVQQPVAHVLAIALCPPPGAVRGLRDRTGRDDRRR